MSIRQLSPQNSAFVWHVRQVLRNAGVGKTAKENLDKSGKLDLVKERAASVSFVDSSHTLAIDARATTLLANHPIIGSTWNGQFITSRRKET
jgi:hypothetical protein